MESPRVTEIKVRIDCNGCVQKIKKALHGINGINDIYIDVPQQKLTIIGWADPEKIVNAIKKTRKLATIYSETQPSPPTEPPLEGCEPPSDPSNPLPTETVPPKEPENPPLEPEPAPPEPPSTNSKPRQPPQISGSKEAQEVQAVHHYPPDYGHRHSHERVSVEYYSSSPSPVFKHEPPEYKPTPYVTDYNYIRPEPPVQQFTHYNRPEPPPQQTYCTRQELPQHYTHYNRPESPPQQTHYTKPEPPQHYTHYSKPEPPPQYTHYNRPEPPRPYTNYGRAEVLPPHYTNYNSEYHSSSNGNGNITSIFSDENPNSCAIV